MLVVAAAMVAAVVVVVAGFALHRQSGDDPMQAGPGAASCAAPQLRLGDAGPATPAVIHRGQQVTLTGRYYLDGCQDNPGAPAPRPLTVAISLHGHGRTVDLLTVRARGSLGTFQATVRIPTDYPLGATRITTRTIGAQSSLAAGVPGQTVAVVVR